MSRSIVRLAEPFFLKVLALVNQSAQSAPHELEELQKKLMADLQAIEAKLLVEQPAGSPDWELCKRILIYWADEVLTRHNLDWQDFVLEQRYHDEKNRAWKFFKEAEEGLPRSSPAVAELCYLAVVLGFEGDIEEAFHRLERDLPGASHDIAEARRIWARQLQRLIQFENTDGPEPELLDGSPDPLGGETAFNIAVASAILSSIVFIVAIVWWLAAANPTAPISPSDSAPAPTDSSTDTTPPQTL